MPSQQHETCFALAPLGSPMIAVKALLRPLGRLADRKGPEMPDNFGRRAETLNRSKKQLDRVAEGTV
jgi:hypothetical protein